jgi:hypothetical protein
VDIAERSPGLDDAVTTWTPWGAFAEEDQAKTGGCSAKQSGLCYGYCRE